MADRKSKPKRKAVSQAQARLYGVVARKGAGGARKVARGELSRPEARSTLRGVKVSALPPRKRSASKPRPKPKPTAARRAATRKRNARRAAGL